MSDYLGMKRVSDLDQADRPRERLLVHGPAALADWELLAILLGSGSARAHVRVLSQKLLPIIDRANGSLTCADLQGVVGIGPAKAAALSAALEFARRRIRPKGVRINGPEDVLPLVRHLANRPQEHFIALTLNGAHEVITVRVVTIGLANSSQVHPREVFANAIEDRACAVILAHNHPSGSVEPSKEDRAVTDRLRKAGDIIGIKVLDHVIFSSQACSSLVSGGWGAPVE